MAAISAPVKARDDVLAVTVDTGTLRPLELLDPVLELELVDVEPAVAVVTMTVPPMVSVSLVRSWTAT